MLNRYNQFITSLKKGSLSWKLLSSILILSSFITLIIVSVQLLFKFQEEIQSIDLQQAQIKKSYNASLTSAMWQLDKAQIKNIIKGMTEFRDVSYVEVNLSGDEIIFTGSKLKQADKRTFRSEISVAKGNTNTNIGTLYIESSMEGVYERIINQFWFVLISQAIKTFLISLFVLAIVFYILTRHLQTIATFIKQLDVDALGDSLQINRSKSLKQASSLDELDLIVDAINKMMLRIKKDIKEIDISQNQLRISQKTEALGTLAGGIAHDLNNMLVPIFGYSGLAMDLLKNDPVLLNYLEQIEKAGQRSKDLVNQILLFSRHDEPEKHLINFGNVIEDVLKLMRPTIPSNVKFEEDIDLSCKNIQGNSSQMHQVILNLCTNAYHAMEEEGGTISLILKGSLNNIDDGNISHSLNEKETICFSVRDTGMGMTEAVKDRIFEPFFTTKDVDKGTGLGLSVVHGIIKSHNGEITVSSELGLGTTFEISIPTVDSGLTSEPNEVKNYPIGNGLIYLVEDNLTVLQVTSLQLKSLGYQVETCSNSLEAAEHLKENSEKYALLISDLMMPKLTGIQLLEKLHKYGINLPTIIISGFTGEDLQNKKLLDYALLRKPFSKEDLAMAISEIMEKS